MLEWPSVSRYGRNLRAAVKGMGCVRVSQKCGDTGFSIPARRAAARTMRHACDGSRKNRAFPPPLRPTHGCLSPPLGKREEGPPDILRHATTNGTPYLPQDRTLNAEIAQ